MRGRCPDQLAALLQAASADLGQAVDELRRITHGLAPAALDRHDLAAALRELAERLASPALRIDVTLSPQPLPPLAADLETALYRIAAEALNNAARHAHADQARLRVDVTREGIDLAVCDNGRGLPPGAHTGIGMRSMTGRAKELGGTIAITGPIGHGTTVHARFPASRVHHSTVATTGHGHAEVEPTVHGYPDAPRQAATTRPSATALYEGTRRS